MLQLRTFRGWNVLNRGLPAPFKDGKVRFFCNLAMHNSAIMNGLSIYTKFDGLPSNLKQEVSDFIDFLVQKSVAKNKKVVPTFGSAKGKIKIAPDFDAPLEDFKDYM